MKSELEEQLRDLIRQSEVKQIAAQRLRAVNKQDKSDRQICEESFAQHGLEPPTFTDEELEAITQAHPGMFIRDPQAAEDDFLDQAVKRLLPKLEELRKTSGRQGPVMQEELMAAEVAWADEARSTLIGCFQEGAEFAEGQGDDEMVQFLKQAQGNLARGASADESMNLADRMLKHVFGRDDLAE